MNPERVVKRLTKEVAYGMLSPRTAIRLAFIVGWEHKDNPPRRPVEQYDSVGHLIGTYSSVAEASRKLDITKQNISKCALGERHTAGGFIWKYIDKKKLLDSWQDKL